MVDFSSTSIPKPLNWQDFERRCHVLFQCIWNDLNAQLNGRGGQPQHGVDIFGRPNNGTSPLEGVQCKGRNGKYGNPITEVELQTEVEKAKGFQPPIHRFTLATTASNDEKIQRIANEITEAHRAQGLFPVVVWGWEELQQRIVEHPRALKAFHPDASPFSDQILKDQEDIKTRQEEHTELLETMRAQIQVLTEGGLAAQQDLSSAEQERLDSHLHGEIDVYRDRLLAGYPRTALSLLEEMKPRVWIDASERVRFRILTNMGAAHLKLQEEEAAAHLFLEAFEHAPTDRVALSNKALAYLLKENFDEARIAARTALEQYPDDPIAASYLIHANAVDESISDPSSLVSPALRNTVEVALAIALFEKGRDRLDEWEHWVKRAYEIDPSKKEARIAKAESLLESTFRDRDVLLGGKLTDAEKQDANNAIKLLESVWSTARTSEAIGSDIAVAINLANAYRFLGAQDQASRIVDDGLTVAPSNIDLLGLRAILYFGERKLETALKVLEPTVWQENIAILRAYAIAQLGNLDEAIAVVDEVIARTEIDSLRDNARILRVDMLRRAGSSNQTLEEAQNLLSEQQESIERLVLVAETHLDVGNDEEARQCLDRALALVGSTSSFFEQFILAGTLYRAGRLEEAGGVLKDIVDYGRDSEPLRLLTVCLLETDQRHAARTLINALPNAVSGLPFFLRAPAALNQRTGHVETARSDLDKYLEARPDDLETRLNWISLLDRLGDKEPIEQFLNGPLNFPDAKPQFHIQLAHMLEHYGKGAEALEYGYETLRRFPSNPKVHVGYVGLLMFGRNTKDLVPSPDVVGTDAAFTVKDKDGRQRSYVILERTDADVSRGELPPSHPLAQLATGHKSGDELVLTEGRAQPETLTIIELKHKYLHALHKSMEGFEVDFPGEPGMHRVRVGEGPGGLDAALEVVRSRHEAVGEIQDLYQRQPVPLGMVASVLGANPLELWPTFPGPTGRIYVCDGTAPERETAFEAIRANQKQGCVADPITIQVMRALGVSDQVIAACGPIGVTDSTINVFRQQRELLALNQDSSYLVVGVEGEHFVRQEVTPEKTRHIIATLDTTISWMKSDCVTVPAEASLDLETEWRAFAQQMDPAFVDSILAAKGRNNLLLCEDHRLRQLARSSLGVDGVWLQPVLMFGHQAGYMKRKNYNRVVRCLIELNHYFTTLDGHVLLFLAEEAEWRPSTGFVKAAAALGGETCDIASSITVATVFLSALWSKPLPLPQKEQLTNTVLHGLVRNSWQHAWTIVQAIFKGFVLPADVRPDFVRVTIAQVFADVVLRWCRGHFIAPVGEGS